MLKRLLGCLLAASLVFSGCNSESRDKSGKGAEHAPKMEKAGALGRKGKSSSPASASVQAKSGSRQDASLSDEPTTGPVEVYYGKVTREAGGKPAAGATLELTGFSPEAGETRVLASTTAASDGSYKLVASSPAEQLHAAARGCARVAVALRAVGSDYSMAPTTRRVRQDVVLADEVVFRGKVIDENNQPVTSVTLRTVMSGLRASTIGSTEPDCLEALSGPDGGFAFEGAVRAKYSLYVDPPRHQPLAQETSAPQENLLIRLNSQGACIEGNVFKLKTTEAVASATVRLQPQGSSPFVRRDAIISAFKTTSTSSGAFRLERLPAGIYTVEAEAGDLKTFAPEEMSFSLAEKETTSGVTVYVYGGHTITGKVTERASHAPVAGVQLTADFGRKSPTGESDAQGRYRIEKVFGQRYWVQAAKKGYKRFVGPREWMGRVPVSSSLPSDRLEVTKDIEMVKAAQVSGMVRMQDGPPVTSASVQLLMPNNVVDVIKTQTDSQGIYEFEVDPFSTVAVKAQVAGYPPVVSAKLRVDDRPVSVPEIIIKPGATLGGKVVDASGKAVEGAQVGAQMANPAGASDRMAILADNQRFRVGIAQSDATGAFSISQLPEGRVYLSATKTGYVASKEQDVSVKAGQIQGGVLLVLQPSHFVSGKISDPKGSPLAGVFVQALASRSDPGRPGALRSESATAHSDDKGRYRIEGLPAGSLTVSASRSLGPGTSPVSQSKENVSADSENVDFVLGEPPPAKTQVDFVLGEPTPAKTQKEAKGKLIGKVVDGMTGYAVSDFSVEVQGGKVNVQKDPQVLGRFVVSGLRAHDIYLVNISAPGYLDLNQNRTKDTVVLESEDKPLEREFALEMGGVVSGRVVEHGSAKPLEGVSVVLADDSVIYDFTGDGAYSQSMRTASDGTFSFEGVPSGLRTLQFRPQSPLAALRRRVEVWNGIVSDLGDVELGSGATLEGKVLKKPGESPLGDVQVRVSGTISDLPFSQSLNTSADGSFRFEGLTPAEYALSLPTYGRSVKVKVKAQQNDDLVLYVGSCALNGAVLKRGQPAARVIVSLQYESDSGTMYTETDGEGKFRFEGITPEKATVTLSAPRGDSSVRETLDFSSGEELERTFKLPWGRITGRVVDSSDNPVAETAVTFQRLEGNSNNSIRANWTSSDGRFSLDGLRGGEYQVSVSAPDLGASSAKVSVPADGDSAEVVLKLNKANSGTLVSTVVDPQGKPISGAWCKLPNETRTQRDANGVMTINDLAPGVYIVSIGCWGYASVEHTVEIKAGETQRLNDTLLPAGALRWTLQDKSGTPLPGVSCTITPLDGSSGEKSQSGVTDATGQWGVRGLLGGDYSAQATPASGKPVSLKVKITPGQLSVENSVVE